MQTLSEQQQASRAIRQGPNLAPLAVGHVGNPKLAEGRQHACSDGHDWEFCGSVNGSVREGCEFPSVLRCNRCLLSMRGRCGATRDHKCRPCAERHRLDISRVGRAGALDRPEGVFFVTLTAPGKGLLPWDPEQCKHAEGVPCSGPLGCRVERIAAAVWNASAPRRWNDFVTDLRRLVEGRDVQYFGAWETQARGLLHRHSLVAIAGLSERTMSVFVRSLARRHGFGTRSDVQSITGDDARSIARTAGYIASYVTKGGERASLLDVATGEVREDGRGYRPWSASRRWGQTLGGVRRERVRWCAGQTAVTSPGVPLPSVEGGDDGAAGALDLEQEIYAVERLLINDLGAVWE